MVPNNYLMHETKANRPISVTLISIYYWLQAMGLWSAVIIGVLSLFNTNPVDNNNPERMAASIVYIVVVIPLAIACTMAGWGLWKTKQWARYLSIGLSIFGLVVIGIPTLISRQLSGLLHVATDALVLVVLLSTKVFSTNPSSTSKGKQ